jgi:hypothetical protein
MVRGENEIWTLAATNFGKSSPAIRAYKHLRITAKAFNVVGSFMAPIATTAFTGCKGFRAEYAKRGLSLGNLTRSHACCIAAGAPPLIILSRTYVNIGITILKFYIFSIIKLDSTFI